METLAPLGWLIALVSLLAGVFLSGGEPVALLQPAAFALVSGGTLGATLVSYPMRDIRGALRALPLFFHKAQADLRPLVEEIIQTAQLARKEGVLAIEAQRASLKNETLRRCIKHIIDGMDASAVREIMDAELERALKERENAANVFEGAGSYAPTMGIIGAILGLIQVMMMLDQPGKIGPGIAAAFVAALYGLGASSFILIPIASKIKRKSQLMMTMREVVKLGVSGIQEGVNPHFLQERLEVLVKDAA